MSSFIRKSPCCLGRAKSFRKNIHTWIAASSISNFSPATRRGSQARGTDTGGISDRFCFLRCCLRGPHRWVQCFEPVHLPSPSAPVLRQEGVYFITGGLGGVGLTLAEYLRKTRKAKLVLLGRSPIPSREQWSSLLADTGSIDSSPPQDRENPATRSPRCRSAGSAS